MPQESPTSQDAVARYALVLEYDGQPYYGWQRQARWGSVQGVVEAALTRLCGHDVVLHGAGRTDAGVHALGQVAHFDTRTPRPAATILSALNALTPDTVAILAVHRVRPGFHARRLASRREYLYRLRPGNLATALDRQRVWCLRADLDLAAMNHAAATLLGQHDFSSFRSGQCQARSPVKRLDRVEFVTQGPEVHFHIAGPSFLHHMVRKLLGTLVRIGRGEWHEDQLAKILAARDPSQAAPMAPAHGLYLVRVVYPDWERWVLEEGGGSPLNP
ncbi:MAG: tRNA pseudouridine(38-40) synthase TruA [Magnetococcus sp. WYHC-3]